ncbi:nuclear transport factor 2 family protein [Nocardioides plantarum]|uniref:Nuclear transport factor 2 family protein n=1 Tax=Nocardioides plantarum TaxID=29299 RepID=A0ABV5KB65_9ACTN|nr:nuclear transport factor 2 family protein [Nocardioides plantarum]
MSTRTLTRVLLSVLAGGLCGVVVTCGVLVLGVADDGDGGVGDPTTVPRLAPEQSATPSAHPRHRAREVLRRWDADRERAWRRADPAALARLYTPGSVAGARDIAMLRAWTHRGARVTELTTQVLRLQVLSDRGRRLVLVVTDRVAQVGVAGVASVGGLPRDRPSTRRIVLVRTAGRWRVASVSPQPPARS